MPYVKCTKTDITPGAGVWTDRLLSDYVTIPAGGVTGVQLEFYSETGSSCQGYARMNGSTDSILGYQNENNHHWCLMVGVDSNNTFEVYVSDWAKVKVYLCGYTTAGFTYFTNVIDMGSITAGAWTTLDCSSKVPSTATALIFVHKAYSGNAGFRNYGSSDYYTSRVGGVGTGIAAGVIVGCTDRKVQYYFTSGTGKLYLAGFIDDDSLGTFFTTKLDYTATGAMPALPTGAYAGIFEIGVGGDQYTWEIEEDSPGTNYNGGTETTKIVTGGDSGICDSYRNPTQFKPSFYLVGWFLAPGGTPVGGGIAIGDYMIF